jgi:hypothetical protein
MRCTAQPPVAVYPNEEEPYVSDDRRCRSVDYELGDLETSNTASATNPTLAIEAVPIEQLSP